MSTATTHPLPTARDLEAALRQALQPTTLEVIDESGAHAGHAGANAEGRGTHFRVRIASPLFEGSPAWRAIALCMMPSKFLSHRVCTPSPSRCSESFDCRHAPIRPRRPDPISSSRSSSSPLFPRAFSYTRISPPA